MSKTILMIDDDLDLTDAVRALLEAKGYKLINAENGKDGVELAKSEHPGLILLDVMMTHKTEGFDTARALHGDETTKDIPVVMVTGIKKEMNLGFGFEPDEDWLPVKAVLEKPIKPDVLIKTVEDNIK